MDAQAAIQITNEIGEGKYARAIAGVIQCSDASETMGALVVAALLAVARELSVISDGLPMAGKGF